jgi:hypothetical protein
MSSTVVSAKTWYIIFLKWEGKRLLKICKVAQGFAGALACQCLLFYNEVYDVQSLGRNEHRFLITWPSLLLQTLHLTCIIGMQVTPHSAAYAYGFLSPQFRVIIAWNVLVLRQTDQLTLLHHLGYEPSKKSLILAVSVYFSTSLFHHSYNNVIEAVVYKTVYSTVMANFWLSICYFLWASIVW